MNNLRDFRESWKSLANSKKATARNVVEYSLLKAFRAKGSTSIEDKKVIFLSILRRAFTAVQNETKLANGRSPFDMVLFWENRLSVHKQNFNINRCLDGTWSDFIREDEIEDIRAVYSALTATSLERKYSYFFTRQDIPPAYQLVQTAHAALELGAKIDKSDVDNLYFACCSVEDLNGLQEVENILQKNNMKYVKFVEPDIGNEATSIGVYPIWERHRGVLKSQPLLRI